LARINAGQPGAVQPGHAAATRKAARSNTPRAATREGSRSEQSNHKIIIGFAGPLAHMLKVIAQTIDSDVLRSPGNPYTPFPSIANG
jgi:hypothetical protein